jgi:cell fate regulator YaaT (PSP1 superfamily)
MDLPSAEKQCNIVEIRFKNSKKEFFNNVNNLDLRVGDAVAVESTPGHDMGVISLTGELVRLQLKKKGIKESGDFKKIYRKAKQADIDKWQEAQKLEEPTMHEARRMAIRLGLSMKISDVEYQGDRSKATFYYTADDRVDFRELIKVMAEAFKVRIEMRQIGARQEASRLGGIGACGRELCCSTWLNDFRTVSTSAARYQQLSLNPLKLAGQCGKLKCCLNYELDNYMDALRDFPETENLRLKTKGGDALLQKTDIFKRIMWFTYRDAPDVFYPLKVEDVKRIIELNKKGEMAEAFVREEEKKNKTVVKEPDYENVVGQDSLTRFDNKNKKRSGKPNNKKKKNRRKPQHENKNSSGKNNAVQS